MTKYIESSSLFVFVIILLCFNEFILTIVKQLKICQSNPWEESSTRMVSVSHHHQHNQGEVVIDVLLGDLSLLQSKKAIDKV